ncbi:MAG: hypothetical protein WA948_01015 [Pontixanthobacter sp.]
MTIGSIKVWARDNRWLPVDALVFAAKYMVGKDRALRDKSTDRTAVVAKAS